MILKDLASVAVSGIWKVGAIAALAGGVLASAALGYQWHMAAHDRDIAKADLIAEQAKSAEYASSIREQNRAVEAMKDRTTEAEKRGQVAQQLAAANGKRFDQALARAAGAKATTCDEAMPVVDAILEAIR